MSTAVKHMIRNATLDFQFNGKTDGLSFQQEVKDWFDEFIGKLDGKLDELSSDEMVISIDDLTLQIELSGTDWRQQASHKLMDQLRDRFHLMQTGIDVSTGYKEKNKGQQFGDSFLYFLEHGHLQWQASTLAEIQWNDEVEKLMLHADEEFKQKLKELLVRSGAGRERLTHIIPFQTAVELFRSFTDQQPAIHQRLIHDLQSLMKIALLHHYSYLKQVVYRAFLVSLSANADPVQIKQELSQSIHKKAAINPAIIESIADLQFQSQRLIVLQKELTTNIKTTRSKAEVKKYKLQKLIREEQELLLRAQNMKQPFSETIYIGNGGLVIAAAFLPALFEKIKLSTDHIINDPDKAVCLVHYLATGHEQMQEFDLVLPKILCGVAIERPIQTGNFHLNSVFRKETVAVLTSIIEYWNILQNTSVQGLRESFLQRNGKLNYDGKDWLLKVEQSPYDMLLQHLPWNISMIKLPWMDQLLKTEWNY